MAVREIINSNDITIIFFITLSGRCYHHLFIIILFDVSPSIKFNGAIYFFNISFFFPSFLITFANTMAQKIDFTNDIRGTLAEQVRLFPHDLTFVLTDSNTRRWCWPLIEGLDALSHAQLITVPAGDEHKNLDSLTHVWTALQEGGATRHSLLINLGGGMVTDLGGFAASTFKRGIGFINIPTSLLAMVDASVGGKTGINFGGLKNEVGTFCQAFSVIICTDFLKTIDHDNLLSGYAEMVKHGLISDNDTWAKLINTPLLLAEQLATSVAVKERIVEEDPDEQNIRKALNFGHTIGHAIESFYEGRLLHGHCVAYGIVGELYLSCLKKNFPTDKMRQTVRFIREHYATPAITCDDYPTLLSLIRHDKKNVAGQINFTLLSNIGEISINQTVTDEEIMEALDFIREG